jgi:hypothetical protein
MVLYALSIKCFVKIVTILRTVIYYQNIWKIGLKFDFRPKQDISLLRSVQTDSLVHPAVYSLSTGVSLGVKGRGVKLNLVPRSRIIELYFHNRIWRGA